MSEYQVFEQKMQKVLDTLEEALDGIRAGRANPAVLSKVMVEYYGTPTPIQQIASVGTPDPRTLVITPWDASALRGIEKAILESDLGINPSNDGKIIRLVLPELNEERRKDLVKQTRKMGEDCKVAVRGNRKNALDAIKKLKKDNLITEDDQKSAEEKIQKATDKVVKEVDAITAEKEKELMGA